MERAAFSLLAGFRPQAHRAGSRSQRWACTSGVFKPKMKNVAVVARWLL
jgi:hypothetical protein